MAKRVWCGLYGRYEAGHFECKNNRAICECATTRHSTPPTEAAPRSVTVDEDAVLRAAARNCGTLIAKGRLIGSGAAPVAPVGLSDEIELRVACITLDGITLTVPVEQIGDVLQGEDGQHTYMLTLKTMTRRDFEAMGDFNGF